MAAVTSNATNNKGRCKSANRARTGLMVNCPNRTAGRSWKAGGQWYSSSPEFMLIIFWQPSQRGGFVASVFGVLSKVWRLSSLLWDCLQRWEVWGGPLASWISGITEHSSLRGPGSRPGMPGQRSTPDAGPVVPAREWNPRLSRLQNSPEK